MNILVSFVEQIRTTWNVLVIGRESEEKHTHTHTKAKRAKANVVRERKSGKSACSFSVRFNQKGPPIYADKEGLSMHSIAVVGLCQLLLLLLMMCVCVCAWRSKVHYRAQLNAQAF